MLQTFAIQKWDEQFSESDQHTARQSLEQHQILHFPQLSFAIQPDEQQFLTSKYADPHAKNISYDAKCKKLWGVQQLTDRQHIELKALLNRFYRYASLLLRNVMPEYADAVIAGRTSFRTIEVCGRKTSARKDDTLIHIDAFPSAPNQGKRILRIFSNVNPQNAARIWRVGEPFPEVAKRYVPKIQKPLPGRAALLRFLKITKSYRTLYDHYMLQMHNKMKADKEYQKKVSQQEIPFAAGTSWMVLTDSVSHSAIKGKFVLEQTFYVPISAMHDETHAPLRILESMTGHKLL